MRAPLLFAWFAIACSSVASAQNIVVGTPQTNVGHSFFENYGIGWSYGSPNAFANFNGGGAVPPFGGYDPGSDARFGFRSGGFSLGLTASQGSSSSITSTTPMLTIPNGGSGAIFSGQITPFVTGFVPVIGDDGAVYGGGPTMLHDRIGRLQAGERPQEAAPQSDQASVAGEGPLRLSGSSAGAGGLPASGSSAERGAAGVEAARAAYVAERDGETTVRRAKYVEALMRADAALARGKTHLAKAYYEQAYGRATDEERPEIEARLARLPAANDAP